MQVLKCGVHTGSHTVLTKGFTGVCDYADVINCLISTGIGKLFSLFISVRLLISSATVVYRGKPRITCCGVHDDLKNKI